MEELLYLAQEISYHLLPSQACRASLKSLAGTVSSALV
jgi:hypothetical protein